ncbi:hypothetical protein UPYG_G00292290 [Umbra pygmaea]|uniref:Coiled-coil domain-containing protein 178 n=1 Tax=Umbra pygmaea TaxID=75934 RepID=A0ABD0WKZ8_UMBPY
MPEVEPLRFPSREGGKKLQDQGDQAVCPSRRRSCALVNTPSPCVNKAVCHIQELKKKLENWCQQSGNVKHQMSHQKQQNSKRNKFYSSDSDSSAISTELYIEGIGLRSRGEKEDGLLSPLHKETTDVLVEVVYLIERLEADRQDAKEALQTEKKRRITLERKIHSIALWKQQEFPAAVQKEHEACTRDISELQWHLKLRRDQHSQVKDRLTKTEVLNQMLNQDIGLAKKNGPLVKEKLLLERDFINQINMAQHEAQTTFANALNELESCQEEMKKEEVKADEARKCMLQELNGIRDLLNDRLAEFQQLLCYLDSYCVKERETKERTALKVKECGDMLRRIPDLEAQKVAVTDQIVELKKVFEIESRKIPLLKEEITELQKEVYETRCAGESTLSQLDEVYRKKHQKVLALLKENKEYDLEMEDYTQKIFESKQTVKQLHQDRKRFVQKIAMNEQHTDEAKEELSQVVPLHSNTKVKLEELEQQTFLEERRIRNETGNLKKDLAIERKALSILKGKITKLKAELNQEQLNTEKARWELGQNFEKASSAAKQLEMKIEKLRKIYNDKSEKIDSLNKQLCDILTEHKNTSNCLEQEKNLKLEHLNTVKELHQTVSRRFDQALSSIADLSAKSKEYQTQSESLEKTLSTLPDIIKELQSVFDATELKKQMATLITNTLERDIATCQQRTEKILGNHTSLLTARKQKGQEIKADLQVALRENDELAHEYIDLQKALMIARREAVRVLDELNRAEASFHDRKQLSLLQKRMHKAVVKSFRQRHLYSLAQLARFQVLSNENNQKIKSVQEELSEAIQRISALLLSLSDDSTNRDGAETMEVNSREETRASGCHWIEQGEDAYSSDNSVIGHSPGARQLTYPSTLHSLTIPPSPAADP